MAIYGVWMHVLNLGPPNTDPFSGREEDLNAGLADYKSSAPTSVARCLLHPFSVGNFLQSSLELNQFQ